MKVSKMFINTLREDPNEAEIPSHKLLLRSGMIRKLVSGVYGFMPMGYRVLRKIEAIIREEMDEKGGQEILMSAIQPAELWQESGRWYDFGPEMFRLKDRHEREFCLGPTHEEIFTDIVRTDISSYRQLPLNLYQIQTKYRDEKRPRFGLMRSREFIMKDAYSFDKDVEGLNKSYQDMFDAYTEIFKRCGLDTRPVEADTGAMGGSGSHEFTALSQYGEGEIAYCTKCDFAATTERAKTVDQSLYVDENEGSLKQVETPEVKTIEQVAAFLEKPLEKIIKTLIFTVEEKNYIALLRGDRTLNETKLINAINTPEHLLEFASDETINESLNSSVGFSGPHDIDNVTIIMDSELESMKNMVIGANKKDAHYVNANYGRDFQADIIIDLKLINETDPCPVCGGSIKKARGIEVGQVFKLGTKYSTSMGALYRDEKMEEKEMVMGCYGIGVTRTMAAAVEQNHDEFGIVWPMSIAPYHVIIDVVNIKNKEQMDLGETLHETLEKNKIEVLLDDRDERVGVKFKDADLLGIPIRIVIGKKAGESIVEFKCRWESEKEELPVSEAIDRILRLVSEKG